MIRTLPIVLAGLILAACASDDDEAVTDGTNPDEGSTVAVTLREHEIELSGEAAAGQVTFELSSEGDQVHGFVVEGNGISETLTSDVRPGSTDRVSIELDAGSYTVWCPIGDHRDRGMEADLEVAEAADS